MHTTVEQQKYVVIVCENYTALVQRTFMSGAYKQCDEEGIITTVLFEVEHSSPGAIHRTIGIFAH